MQTSLYRRVLLAGAVCLAPSFLIAQKLPYGLPASMRGNPAVTPAKPSAGTTSATTQYTFAVHGVAVHSPAASRLSAEAGTIVVDSNGNVVGGEIDVDSPVITAAQVPVSGGTVTLNADLTGSLTLLVGGTTQSFAFVAASNNGVISSAALLENDGLAGQAGTLVLQPTLSTPPQGNFSLSLSGETFEQNGVPDGVGVAGNLALSGQTAVGKVSVFVGDAGHSSYTNTPFLAYSATVSTPDSFGRSVLTLALGGNTVSFAAYAVSATSLNLVATDPVSATTPVIFGTAVQ